MRNFGRQHHRPRAQLESAVPWRSCFGFKFKIKLGDSRVRDLRAGLGQKNVEVRNARCMLTYYAVFHCLTLQNFIAVFQISFLLLPCPVPVGFAVRIWLDPHLTFLESSMWIS